MSIAAGWKTWEGRTVDGKFPLRQCLGSSDHSVVFLTERRNAPQKAAIKLVAADDGEANRHLTRWHDAAQLSHPHLVRIFETGRCQFDGTPYLYVVMECADDDLSQVLPERPLTSAEVGEMLPPLLDALAYLHAKGFVHGRVKPSNVMAVEDQLKLTSDDIASAKEATSGRGRRDVYDAPETAAGTLSPASDMWSVGATLVATLMQSARFSGEPAQGDPGLPPTMPEPFRSIASQCLHFDPRQRSSIAGIQARLKPAGGATPAESKPVASSRERRGTKRAFVVGALMVAVLLVAAVIFFSRGKSTTETAQPSGTSEQSQQSATQPSAPATPSQATPSASTATAQPSKPATAARGAAVHQVLPDVPQSARDTITGHIRVSVRVEVNSAGKVTEAKLTSPGPSKYFANLALKAARGWEFEAPQVSGQATSSVWVLHFRFGRARTEATPQRVTR